MTKLTGNNSVNEHLCKFFDLVDKLKSIDMIVDDDLLSVLLLYSLPEQYEGFRIAIESRDILPKPDVLKIKIMEESDARAANVSIENETKSENGISERKNRTLLDMARCLLLQSELLKYLWAGAIATANHIRNRCPSDSLNGDIPYKFLNTRSPNIVYFKSFGSLAYVLNKIPSKGKLEARSTPHYLLGYDENSKTYRLWNKNNRSDNAREENEENYETPDEDILITCENASETILDIEKSSYRDEWENAIKRELESHKKNNTWIIADRKDDMKPVGCKRGFTEKTDESRKLIKRKARLVAKGYSQIKGFNFSETYAPVAKMKSMRILAAISAKWNLKLYQFDVAIYGLKQSGKAWNSKLKAKLLDCGFSQLKTEPCLYKINFGNFKLIVLIYVDDILVATNNENLVKYTYDNKTLIGYTDADWGSNIDDRKLFTGYIFKLSGAPISWDSRKQKTIALSSTEAEYLSLTEATKESIYLRELLQEIDFQITQPVTIFNDNKRCYHNGTLYADGSFVPTLQPCLNCKCNTRTLICSLKICSEMPVPPPRGCILIQKKNNCCPYLSCLKLHDKYNNALSQRITSYLDSYEREGIDRVVNDNFLQKRSDDKDLYGIRDICVKKGTIYKAGSAMSSSSLCSYCYCIGGQQKCVKPKCMLSLGDCKPVFVASTCCPVRYDCSYKSAGGKSWLYGNKTKTSNNKHYQRMSQRLQRNRGCHYGNNFYLEGQKTPSDNDKPCYICFCIKGKRKCAPKKCAPFLQSCIPIIPKGQCCPSSYDCSPSTREWDRTHRSRQIDLLSWILESQKDLNNFTELGIPKKTLLKQTTEKSVIDVIGEGLQIIDSKANTDFNNITKTNGTSSITEFSTTNIFYDNLLKDRNPSNLSSSNSPVTIYNVKSEDHEGDINLFDLFLQTVTNVTGLDLNETSAATTTSSTLVPSLFKEELDEDYKDYDGINFFDIFLGKTEKNLTTSEKENLNETEPIFDYFGLFNDNETYDYISVSDSNIENENHKIEDGLESESNLSTTDNIELRSEIYDNPSETTTFKLKHEDAMQLNEHFYNNNEGNYFQSAKENLNTTPHENYSMEDGEVDSISNDESFMEEVFPTKNNIPFYKTTTPSQMKMADISEQKTTGAKTLVTKSIFNPTKKVISFTEPIQTKKQEIFNESSTTKSQLNIAITKKVNGTEVTPIKLESKPQISFLSTVIDELQLLIRKTSNASFINGNEAINSYEIHKANKTVIERNNEPKKDLLRIPPFKKIIINENLNHILNKTSTALNSEPIVVKSNSTVTKFKTVMSSINVGSQPIFATEKTSSPNFILLRPTTKVESTFPSNKSVNLNMLVANEEYDRETLPPSLPNLEIIPFLPIDALPLKENIPTFPTFSTITEQHKSDENMWSDLVDNVRPFENSGSLSSSPYISSKDDRFNEVNRNKFSPPREIEGGFVPKQPIVDGSLYYDTKLITELRTTTPPQSFTKNVEYQIDNETPIAITSIDPFKDVIKTEPPPDLDLLIEDKEKRLVSKNSKIYNDKEIVHITTDATYNYDIDSKQNNVIQFSNVNFENLSIAENNNVLMESFPLDRHDNSSLPEKNNNMSDISQMERHKNTSHHMFDVSPNVDGNVNIQFLENDILVEDFPLDKHVTYKKVNNLTFDNVDMVTDENCLNSDSTGIESFLDYFLGVNSNSKLNLTTTGIPPFKVIPPSMQLLTSINSEVTNQQLQSDIMMKQQNHVYKNNSTDLKNKENIGESELYKPKLHRPFPFPNTNGSVYKNDNNSSFVSNSSLMSDPFKGLPSLIPSYPIKKLSQSKNSDNNIHLTFTQMQKELFTVESYKTPQNKTYLPNLDSYIVNPVNIEELKKRQQQQKESNVQAQIYSKPEHTNSVNDPSGILKLAGCNIYGRMYRVGRIISELSNSCLECRCTEIGVNCISLECSRTLNE
ncbi:uncharacterized protein LOC129614726 [Condylostylus longicornis]|uniref:uncharacterized protein LOC129614726 n=1 Tax=Condylostylus longicornis TaxID=2530218 RepID=UPI00244E5458|nr:uncharacterized protein LOC129614726 [Condylostylus longicornis]